MIKLMRANQDFISFLGKSVSRNNFRDTDFEQPSGR